jgi:YD repeat-containing protein
MNPLPTTCTELGRILAGQQITDGQTYNFAYTYNLAGSLTSKTYQSGRVTNTGYDQANRTLQVFGGLGTQQTTYVGDVSYAAHGEPALYNYANALYRNFTYNNHLQPVLATDTVQNNAGNKHLELKWN